MEDPVVQIVERVRVKVNEVPANGKFQQDIVKLVSVANIIQDYPVHVRVRVPVRDLVLYELYAARTRDYSHRSQLVFAVLIDDTVIVTEVLRLRADERFLFLCDRKRDMVISGGVNIYPAEIEAVLIGIEGVADCAVFGVPDPEFGESLLAVVERAPDSTITPKSVQAELRGRLARYKVPKRIEFRTDLPREDTGKIYKRKLRDPYWKDAKNSI